jgi:predicted nucleic acid binding AN1-type Zn finger protein
MGTCDKCGQPLDADRECSYCEQSFCGDCRLPENHGCPGVENWEGHGKRFDSGFGGFAEEGDGDG